MPEKKEFSTPLTPGLTRRDHIVFFLITLSFATISLVIALDIFPQTREAESSGLRLVAIAKFVVAMMNCGIWAVLVWIPSRKLFFRRKD